MLEAVVDAVGDGTVVVQRGEHFLDLVHDIVGTGDVEEGSCWPAKEASGRSSAVAEERTATATSPPPLSALSLA